MSQTAGGKDRSDSGDDRKNLLRLAMKDNGLWLMTDTESGYTIGLRLNT